MITELIEKLTRLDFLLVGGLLSGMVLQYIFGVDRTWRTVGVILITTVYLAFYVLNPLFDYLDGITFLGQLLAIPADSPIRIFFISLTALISQTLVAILIKMIPQTFQERLKIFTGYKKP